MTRDELALKINQGNLAGPLSALRSLFLSRVARELSGECEPEAPDPQEHLRSILNQVGPAAASASVNHAVRVVRSKGLIQNTSQLNNSYVNNFNVVCNDSVEAFSSFDSVLRQFLLPRYAYLDFDQIVDPRHKVDSECGYPKFITPIMYRYMYDRDDISRRVVDIYPDESWAADPDVYETDNEEEETEFEAAWRLLKEDYNIMSYLYRMDRLSGVGHYGVLLLGINDGKDLSEPVDELDLLAGARRPVAKTRRELLYLRPFDEYLSFIWQYETNPNHPRYGLPLYYNLVFLDMTIDAAGASIGTRLNRRVHWTRVVHVADNLGSSLCFATPRMQPCFNRLLDLRKIKGACGEMLWKGGFPGISFELDPRLVADEFDFDKDKFREELANYTNGMQRMLTLVGIKANSLAPNIPTNPEKYVQINMEAIAAHYGVPLRKFLGSEEGRLASDQDKLTWNTRLKRHCEKVTEPFLIRAAVDRFIAVGVLPQPKSKKYYVDWGDLNASTDEDKANLALKWSQAISQYVSTGMIHFIAPIDYMTMILGLSPRNALKIDEYIKSSGGYEKLKKVDPSEQGGAGQNGVRKNTVGKAKDAGKASDKHKKRDTSTKKAEGTAS